MWKEPVSRAKAGPSLGSPGEWGARTPLPLLPSSDLRMLHPVLPTAWLNWPVRGILLALFGRPVSHGGEWYGVDVRGEAKTDIQHNVLHSPQETY